MNYTSESLATLNTALNTAVTGADSLSNYATTDSLTAYATTEALTGYATTDSLTAYATQDSLTAYATQNDLSSAIGDINTVLDSINGEVI